MALLGSLNLAAGLGMVLVIYIVGTIIYRLHLSPLACIPGPRLAALTSWYECFYDLWKPAQYAFKILELHKQYGPIVRISPSEISISDPAFLDTIYAPSSGARRNKDSEKVKALGFNSSVGGAIQHDLHRRRREALNPYFSQTSVFRSEPALIAKVAQLRDQLNARVGGEQPFNLSDLYFAFASDIVSQYCFGHNPDHLSALDRAGAIRRNVATTLRGVKFNLHFSWVRDLVRKVPALLGLGDRFVPRAIKEMMRMRMRIRQEVQAILDSNDQPADHGAPSVFYELRDNPNLPPSEKTVSRLEDEAILLIMAGTESAAKSICIAQYYLLANPSIMSKLRSELAHFSDPTLAQLLPIPYVQAISMEANRLSFGLTGRQPRVAPDTPMFYQTSTKSYTIPTGTPVSTSTLLVHANPDIFPDPWKFDPERWLGKGRSQKGRYMLAYSKGPRMCIGHNLANAELALTIVEMTRWDMRLFETTEDDVKFLHDYHVATPRLDSSGVRAIVVGRHDLKASG